MKKLLIVAAMFSSFAFSSESLNEYNEFNDAQLEKRNAYVENKCGDVKDVFKNYSCSRDAKKEAGNIYPMRGHTDYIMAKYSELSEHELKNVLAELYKAKGDILRNSEPNARNKNEAIGSINAEISFIKNDLL